MVAYTTTYNLKKPTVADDEDVWGGYLNDSMDLIDDVLDGTTPVTGIDINSGTLDDVVIGGTTANTGTFTVLSATTSLGVTGNITVSGTVDGRDIATDGTKLDGIESGATADQTKADIDALGIAASTAATLATARNIAVTGAVTGNANFDGSGNISIATTATSDPTLTLSGDVTGSATFTNLGNATLSTTIAANSVALGTDTTGNYVAGATAGTGIAVSGTAGEGWSPTIALAAAGAGAGTYGSTSNATKIDTITLDAYGRVTAVATGAVGDIQGVTAGNGLTGGGTSGTPTLNVGAGTGVTVAADTVSIGQDVATSASPTFSSAYIASYVYHSGDTNSYLGFSAGDDFRIVVGGRQILRCDEGTNPDKIQFYDSSNFINTNGVFQVAGTSQSAAQIEGYSALSGTTPSINVTSAGGFSLTMSGNTTFSFTGATSGKSQGFVLQLTGNGSTVTWPTSVDWAGGTAPDAPASGETDLLVFWTRDGGTTWYGVQSIDAAA